MSKLKTLLGYLVIIAIIGGVGLLAYFAMQNQDNTISFKGEDVSAITGEVGEEVELPKLTKDGYDFLGWFYDSELTNPCGETIIIQKGSTILYPAWQIKYYTVTVKYINGGEVGSSDQVPYGQKITLPNDIKPDFGYRVVWVESLSGKEIEGNEVVIKENCQFEQIQKPKTYTLNYQYNDTSTNQSFAYSKNFLYKEDTDSVYLKGDEADVVGHTLTGWFYLGGANKDVKMYIKDGDFLSETMARVADANDNLTIYGEYDLNSYNLIVKDEEKELARRQLLFNASIKEELDAIKESGVAKKDHYNLVGWRYFDSTNEEDFKNVKMPANDIEISPIYDIEKFNITFTAHLNLNKVKVKDVVVEYNGSLFAEDVSNIDAEIVSAVENCENWVGYSNIDEYQFDYCYLASDKEKTYKTLVEILPNLSGVEKSDDVVLVYKKTVFYIEYYRDYNFTTKECSNYITRKEIGTKEDFSVLDSIQHTNPDDYAFGGWAFADDPSKTLDYDSYDDVNIGSDIMVFADFYRNDPTRWQFTTMAVDGENLIYATRYVGYYQNVVVPVQSRGTVYGIGGMGPIISDYNTAIGKRFLVYDSIREICSDAFKNLQVFVRFKETSNPDLEKTGLTIRENAFTSHPFSEKAFVTDASLDKVEPKSIKRIKLPTRTIKVEEGAFSGAFELESIDVSKGCAKYYSKDGVLYERIEGSPNVNLIAYPIRKQNEMFVVGANVERICKGAFYYNISTSLYSITANYNLEKEEVKILKAKLEEVTIESGNVLKSIGEKAFFGNYQMMKIELPSLPNLESVGDGAFSGCFSSTTERKDKNLGRSFIFDLNNLSSIPKEMLATARDLDNFTILNMDNVSYIGDRAFIEVGGYINQNLKTDKSDYMIILRGQVNYIGASAFYSSWFDIGFSSTFSFAEIDGVKPTIYSSAFGSGGSTSYGKHRIMGIDGLETLILDDVDMYQRVFSGAIIDVNMKFINCNFNISESGYMGNTFSGSTLNGNLDIIYTNGEAQDIGLRNYTLRDLNVNGDVTIDYKNFNGMLYERLMQNFSCNTLTIKGVSVLRNGIFGTEKNNYANRGPRSIVFDNSCTFTELGEGALNNCDNLISIVLPASITSIDFLAFANITMKDGEIILTSALLNLQTVVINNGTSVISVNGDLLINDTVIKFKVPSSIINGYANDANWGALYAKGLIEAF